MENNTSVNPEIMFDVANFASYLVEYIGIPEKEIMNKEDIFIFIINEEYASVYIRPDLINNYEDTTEARSLINQFFRTENFEVVYVLPPEVYTLQQISAVQASNVGLVQIESSLNLRGKGVVVGIIDTGIDYLNDEFKDENGNTRINNIWDQTIGFSNVNGNPILGTIYNKDKINEAIRAYNSGGDPYEIVPSKDEIGHGTNMAGIVGASGKNLLLRGVAPECEFAVVKLLQPGFLKKTYGIEVPVFGITSIILAIEYLSRYLSSYGKPVVILLPLGTNSGNHRGRHILNNYIASISTRVGIVVVTGTGNEGVEDLHTSDILRGKDDFSSIEMLVAQKQRVLFMGIWIGLPNIMEVDVISPSGVNTGYIPAILNISKRFYFIFEQTRLFAYYSLPEEYTGDQLIRLYFYDIEPGIWKINIRLRLGNVAEYNAWLPQRGLTLPGTRFISSTQYGTVTIPGDTTFTITVTAYNQNNNNLLPFPGVAFRDRLETIDFAAGGYNTMTVGPNNQIDVISGTSLATAIGAGACALLFEWGIVNRNFPYMNSQTLKTFLSRGVYQRSGDVYPNAQLGNGIIDFYRIFENIT